MKLSDEQISGIAESILDGMICYVDRNTGEVKEIPAGLHDYGDPELWQGVIDEVEAGDYIAVEPMYSSKSFEVMEDFVDTLPTSKFKADLIRILSNRKPFANFKYEVEGSKYREEWLVHRLQANIQWVRRELWALEDEEE